MCFLSKNENIMYQNLWDADKAVLGEIYSINYLH